MQGIEGRIALVTGAGSGIGRGMVHAFAGAGMDVVVADIDLAAAQEVAAELAPHGIRVLSARVDVSELEQVEALAERAWRELGGVHLLCNNAGVTTFGLMCDGIPDDDWRWVLEVNLKGVINGLQAFLPRMKALDGEKYVVNTASTAGVAGSPFVAPYAATKHGVVGLSDTLRIEGAQHGIGCSVLCPSSVATRIVDSERNRHDAWGGARGTSNEGIAASIAEQGLDPLHVGQQVLDAVREDVPYIFTHAETQASVDARYEAMVASFEWAARWRSRQPD